MADISIADLEAFKDQVAANDIFSQLGDPLIGFKPQTLTIAAGDPSVGVMPKVNYINPFEQLATSFGTSLLGGLAKNYGRQQQAAQLASLSAILPKLLADPASVGTPEGVDASAFDIIKQKAIASDAARNAKRSDAAFGAMLTNPKEALAAGKLFGVDVQKLAGLSPAPDTTASDGTTPKAEKSSTPTLDKFVQDMLNPDAAKDLESSAKELRDRVEKNTDIKDAMNMGRIYTTLADMIEDPSAVADAPFLINFVKFQDPRSIVSQNEKGAVIQESSLPSQFVSYVNKVLSGEGNIPLRGELLDVMGKFYQGQRNVAQEAMTGYENLARKKKIPVDEILLPKLPEIKKKGVNPLVELRDAMKAAKDKGDMLELSKLSRKARELDRIIGKSKVESVDGTPVG